MEEFAALYRRYASAVFRFAWGLSGERSTAEDIVSETFVRVLTRAPRLETQTALAYLLAVARNTYLTMLRQRRREVALPEEIAAAEPDLAQRLDERLRLDGVLRALRSLPEGERAALLLRVDHGLSYEEIAASLGTSEGAARVRVHRARVRLASAEPARGRLR